MRLKWVTAINLIENKETLHIVIPDIMGVFSYSKL